MALCLSNARRWACGRGGRYAKHARPCSGGGAAPSSTVTPSGRQRATPLLFVSGLWLDHTVWSRYQAFFAEQGFESRAMHAPGACSVKDQIALIEVAVQELCFPPIIVAHGTAGFAAQRFLESHAASGMVLMASLPPSPAACTDRLLALAREDGGLLGAGGAGGEAGAAGGARQSGVADLLHPFRPAAGPGGWGEERGSEAAGSELLMNIRGMEVNLEASSVPMMVLAGGSDAIVCAEDAEATADYHGVHPDDLRIFPGVGHALMGGGEEAGSALHSVFEFVDSLA